MKFCLIFLFLSFKCLAYTSQDINLSDYGFNRYVKPGLINLTQDYYTLLILMNPELKSLKPVNGYLSKLKKQVDQISKEHKLKHRDEMILSLQESIESVYRILKVFTHPLELSEKEFFSAEGQLISSQEFTNLREEFFQFLWQLKNTLLFTEKSIELPYSLLELDSRLTQLDDLYNLFLIKSSDQRFQLEFTSFWSQFIRATKELILPTSDKDLFVAKINEFNLRFNILNMTLTKRNKIISKPSQTHLKIMHNRWINILKVSLKRS